MKNDILCTNGFHALSFEESQSTNGGLILCTLAALVVVAIASRLFDRCC